MKVLIAKNIVLKESRDEFLKTARALVEETRREPGCIFYDLAADEDNENIFYFVEKYKDEQSVRYHRETPHFKSIVPKLQKLREDSVLTTCRVVEE